MYQVKGKWALITGAARGIGYLSAKFMAEQGCNLILHSRDLRHTEKVVSEVRAMGVSAFPVAADLNDPEVLNRIFETAAFRVEYRSLDEEKGILHGAKTYLLQVTDKKLRGEQMPIDYARPRIEKIVLSTRQVEFLQKERERLYNEAIQKGTIKFYE